MQRGQVSIEAMAAAAMLLIALLVLLMQSSERSQKLEFLSTSGVQGAECSALQSAISTLQSVPENSEIELSITNDVNFSKNTMDFGGYFCSFSGNQINAQILRGNVRISRVDGVVSVSNF